MAEHKFSKKSKIITAVLLAIPLLLLCIAAVAVGSLYVDYNKISYAPAEIVERTDTYTLPAYPELIIGSEGISDLPEEPAVPETTAPAAPVETTAPEIAPNAPVTAAPESQPAVTAPPVTTPPDTSPITETFKSFAESPNAISVYGNVPIYKVEPRDPDVMNILVLGTDSRDVTTDRGRSDTMLVVSYNKKTGTIKMISLLRDALVPIEGWDWNRINTAYAFGGVGLAVNTVNQLFGLDIQHFVVMDIGGAKEFIDYVGGVDITLTQAEIDFYTPYIERKLQPGLNHLNGDEAVLHLRNRSTDNDFGRTRRQRDVISAVFRKILTEKSLTEIYGICEYAMGLVKTNISASQLVSLATSVVANQSSLSMETQSVPYADAFQFAWYRRMAIISFDLQKTAQRVNDFLY